MAVTPLTMKTSEILSMLISDASLTAAAAAGLTDDVTPAQWNTAVTTLRASLLDELDRRVPIPAPTP